MVDRAQSRPIPPAPADVRIAAAVSTYHHDVTGAMFRSAVQTLKEAGVDAERVVEVRVPGAFELPLAAQRLAERGAADAVLCFGLILKGETEHDRHIATAVAQGLMQVGLELDTPVHFGVLTCGTLEQAQRRARTLAEGGLDKGREVALAAIETLRAMHDLAGTNPPIHESR